MLALAVEQQLVVDVGQQELDAPALHAQLVLHQDDGAAVVASLGTRDHADLVSAGTNPPRGVFPFTLAASWMTCI